MKEDNDGKERMRQGHMSKRERDKSKRWILAQTERSGECLCANNPRLFIVADSGLVVVEEGIRGRTSLPQCLLLVFELARLLHERAGRAESADQGVFDEVAADAVALTSLEAGDALQRGLADTGQLRSECIETAPQTDVLRRRGGCEISDCQ